MATADALSNGQFSAQGIDNPSLGNRIRNLQANPQLARAAMDAHPVAAGVGSALGSAANGVS